ncbi:hypothetical protein [Oryzomonas japonica]|uniref:hypothetical protein n=1 Tax=Oryzomonas japonica TaxID=2603858 RepID=UPI001783D2D8|nr:hypothetical protein [Oryzomonas japonica]
MQRPENHDSSRDRNQRVLQKVMPIDTAVSTGVMGVFTLGVILFAGLMARMWWVAHS